MSKPADHLPEHLRPEHLPRVLLCTALALMLGACSSSSSAPSGGTGGAAVAGGTGGGTKNAGGATGSGGATGAGGQATGGTSAAGGTGRGGSTGAGGRATDGGPSAGGTTGGGGSIGAGGRATGGTSAAGGATSSDARGPADAASDLPADEVSPPCNLPAECTTGCSAKGGTVVGGTCASSAERCCVLQGSDGGADASTGPDTAGDAGAVTDTSVRTDVADAAPALPFLLGADVSMTQGQKSFVDTDGQSKSIFALLKNHGFNYIRLKTFVEPTAIDWNGCTGSSAGDKAHVIEYGAQVKAEGMGFLLDFHYSDVWADPGNQIIPKPWRGATSPEQLAGYMEDYTYDVISSAIAAGARPDMVQIGNEITPGILAHLPGSNTDCWGNNPAEAPRSIAGWANSANLITYLKAGIRAVRAADPTIKIVLHTEKPTSAVSWLAYVVNGGVDVDIFGLSCYEAWQDGAVGCRKAFTALIADQRFDGIDFIVAEYNPQRTEMNLMMRDLAGGRGLGTFFWEPTSGGEWGPSMFTGNKANSADFKEYDDLLPELGLTAW